VAKVFLLDGLSGRLNCPAAASNGRSAFRQPKSPRAASGVICSQRPLAYAVIPAKAGIQSLDNAFPEVCGVDSRFRGNDGVRSTLSMQMTPLPRAVLVACGLVLS
jgi:hypothetical protein